NGKAALKSNETLFRVARSYAYVMAKADRYAKDVDARNTPRRVKEAGYEVLKKDDIEFVWSPMALSTGEFADGAVRFWSSHPDSTEQLIGPYTDTGIGIGIGIANNKKEYWFYYLILATPAK